mmetsp:Transcript_11657/g.15208  ORF Transcript_11657/g.15208 Transcript_11657/m.15208 type:complete len:81 (+) Transcript_11657:441-683(+)
MISLRDSTISLEKKRILQGLDVNVACDTFCRNEAENNDGMGGLGETGVELPGSLGPGTNINLASLAKDGYSRMRLPNSSK